MYICVPAHTLSGCEHMYTHGDVTEVKTWASMTT